MAIYEYKCPECGLNHETYRREEEGVKCPLCKAPMIKKVSMPAGVHFKGSGFYETDYKDK